MPQDQARGPVARRLAEQRGVAAAEFAVVAPVLVLALMGALDIANLMQTSMRLERAARAGAQYASASASDMAAVRDRVIAAWPELTTTDVPLPVLACECAGSAASCGPPCPSGGAMTVTVTAARSLSPRLLSSLSRGHGSAVVRLR